MKLYSLALMCAGRHVLDKGTVAVHLVLLHHLLVHTLRFTPEELEAHARRLTQELEEMDQFS